MKHRAHASTGTQGVANSLEGAGQVVVSPGGEVRLQLGVQIHVRTPEPVHPDHPTEIIAVELHQPADGRDAGEHNNGEQRNSDRDERGAEA